MRPIIQQTVATGSTFNFPPIIPDIMLTPGNATWQVQLNSATGTATVSLWYSNDDPFAQYPNSYAQDAFWLQEQSAFQTPGATTTVATITLSSTTTSALGAYARLPRGLQFRLTGCTSNPNVEVDFVQASGGIA